MDVTIIGGGVCGLALAHELAPDHHVTVLEASPGPRGGGYMIDFFGPGFVAAERMGVIEELRSRGHAFEGVRYGLPDGTQSGTLDVAPLVKAAGGRYFSILRPEVELGLLAQLPDSVDLRYGKRVLDVRDAGPQHAAVDMGGGEVLESDLVVACDGVRSPAREHVAPGHGAIIPMGYRVASYLFEDAPFARELGERMLMTDTAQRIGWLYAADAQRVGVMLAERLDPSDARRPTADPERLQAVYAGLHPQIDEALTRAPDSFYDDLGAQSWAPRWSRGRIALAGDAAHAPSLLAGQGTSLAIAGAEALARSLRAAGPHVEVGLAEYERRWRTTAERTRRSGRLSASAFIPENRMQVRLQQIGRRAIGLPGVSRLLTRRFLAA
ncbi:FAD-dependent monooxygenase [Brachybacterium sacelli]|uniref:2-polyprenyl-6-methoxyphenol hydroxylase-like FAD-dependent oxidoreductase n=1 Tax=Brachybacterium sacelli TaxID=173364 RepID=A0ABS4WVQ6_9MICO|nr:FAD-dependent monooxygenase [Brachybacterium sacelli]MBP2380282.1 2-polyprenyl-6-methoxyphenol hydroxylase-like FAD-dependent oxidoreductase [Brachybacterium sacelli]